MELSIDAGYQRFAWGDQILDPFFGKEKGVALKLVRSKFEEHSIKIAVRSGTVAQEATRPPGRATAVPSF